MENSQHTFAPDFYVVGAAKAGTTAIFTWLQTHREVFLPDTKEPGFFAYAGCPATPLSGPYDPDYVMRIAVDQLSYSHLYNDCGARLSGDASPVYLLNENAATRISASRPDARIVIVLRDPVERAYSQFLHHVRDGLEPCGTFEAALEAEEARLRDGWSWGHGYAAHGHYAAQIERYLNAFKREQILFLEYENLQSNAQDCWRKICAHLGISQCPLPPNERVNATSSLSVVSGRPGITRALRHPGKLQTLLKPLVPCRVRALLRLVLEGRRRAVPPLGEDTRMRLGHRYHGERKQIESQTGLTLAHWTGAEAAVGKNIRLATKVH